MKSYRAVMISVALFLTGIFANHALAGTATLNWNANTETDLAGYKIYYGTSVRTSACPPGGYANSVNAGKVTSYTFNNLTDGATYYFSVTSYDTSNNESCFSAQVSKAIPAATPAPGDTQAPTVFITSPSNNSTVSGTISVSANASDNIGVAGVQFKIKNPSSSSFENLGNEDTTSPYTINLNTTTGANGVYGLIAVARDAAGNQTTSSQITITVGNAVTDTQAPTTPANLSASAISATQINLTWTASADNVGVAGYRIYRGGTQIATASTNSYSNTGLNSSTNYSYAVAAYDAAGNVSGQSAAASATTLAQQTSSDSAPPAISLTAPNAGAAVSGTVTVSASTSDNVGVTGVMFKLDGANLGSEDTTSPYSISWDTTAASNGSHLLTATARDAAGNQTTSASRTVTVINTVDDNQAPADNSGNTSDNSTTTDDSGDLNGPFPAGTTTERTRNLQRWLSRDRNVYPEGLVTGYYGNLTREAVKRFQCKYNIVCGGDSSTTGYGNAGPITVRKMNEVFGNNQNSQTTSNQYQASQQTQEQRQQRIREIQDQINHLLEQVKAFRAQHPDF